MAAQVDRKRFIAERRDSFGGSAPAVPGLAATMREDDERRVAGANMISDQNDVPRCQLR
jgi:hypothetical protein